MTEDALRRSPRPDEPQPPVIDLELGQEFHPFRDLTQLPESLDVEYGDDHDIDGPDIFSSLFRFRGADGEIILLGDKFAAHSNSTLTAPLGNVGYQIDLVDGKFVTRQMPLGINLELDAIDQDELEGFSNYSIEFLLGSDQVYLSLARVGNTKITPGDTFLRREKQTWGVSERILLPYSAQELTQIPARIVERVIPVFPDSPR